MTSILVTDRDQRHHELSASPGSTLMEALRDEGMGIEAICGGQCACATCHCLIEPAWFGRIGAPGADELDLLSSLEHFDPARSRLTCQIEVTDELDGISLTVAPDE
jgi:2Fe-2S ferredoxin